MSAWKPEDRCRLVNLKIGAVLDGKIEVVRGHKMVVQTDDGRRWSADVDSSFVQRPDRPRAAEDDPADGA